MGVANSQVICEPRLPLSRENSRHRNISALAKVARQLVLSLTSTCHAALAGYTVKREFVSTEYYRGIENIGFDSIAGLNSPMFIRTVKLKDFPWNGWLVLGIATPPAAAWNPIGGFSDGFGRLMWSALSDPGVMPSPNDAGWMLNRILDVRSQPVR